MKIGLIAGGGALPRNVVAGAQQSGRDIYVAILKGFGKKEDFPEDSDVFGLAEFGKITRSLKRNNCTHICFAGNVTRPDFRTLKPDLKGLKHLPSAIKAAQQGDDSLLSFLLSIFEAEGFEIISPQEICANMLIPEGDLCEQKLTAIHIQDVKKARDIAAGIGSMDIGQGAVVCRGLVLAVEAQEGTDAMLKRVATLPKEIRGSVDNRDGVLAKIVKPGQEDRIDLPTIGIQTVRLAAAAGLAGIVAEQGRAFIIDRDMVVREADDHGLFIHGLQVKGTQ